MMASDNNGTSTSLFAWDDLIDLAQTFALVGNLELLSKIIISDRSSIDDGVRWQHILDKIDQHLTMVISSGIANLLQLHAQRSGQHHQQRT